MRHKKTKETATNMATKLGYSIEMVGSRIYLVKDEERILKKSFRKVYEFCYHKLKKINNQRPEDKKVG